MAKLTVATVSYGMEHKESIIKNIEEINPNSIRPVYEKKFRPTIFKSTMHQTVADFFQNKVYKNDECNEWCKALSIIVRDKLKVLELPRYKYVTQVVIGEMRGQGVKVGCRTFWDSDTDNYIEDVYMNGTLFCVVACFGIYFY